uniref:RanBP2-type domain-containing protein n=1 Tax=Globisporangium ultimum (strain ATCC 200006 / CBS 805.95 / DAOM BR144) TaxID=431595 RepID=K3WCX5_GLOUD
MADEESNQWSCSACTLMNAFLAEACEACGATSPLVIESYACEEQGFTTEEQLEAIAAVTGNRIRTNTNNSTASSSRSRGSSRNSTGNFAGDIAGEMDPWVQAEREWANVEAHQEERPKRK